MNIPDIKDGAMPGQSSTASSSGEGVATASAGNVMSFKCRA